MITWVGQIPRTAGSNRMHFDKDCQTVLTAVTPSYALIIQGVLTFLTEMPDILIVVNLILRRTPCNNRINFRLRKKITGAIFKTLQGFHGRRDFCVGVRAGHSRRRQLLGVSGTELAAEMEAKSKALRA